MTERRYGKWAGNPRGVAEDPNRCIEEVFSAKGFSGYVGHQCSRPRGQGANGEYCTIHSRDTKRVTPIRRTKGESR